MSLAANRIIVEYWFVSSVFQILLRKFSSSNEKSNFFGPIIKSESKL